MSSHRILIGALATTLLCGCAERVPEKPEIIRPVKAMQVTDAGTRETRSFPGRAQAYAEVDLSFRVSGTLIELPNNIIGQEYTRGDVIARLDPRDYEVAARDSQGRLEKATANATRAQSDYRREQNIYREDAGATSEAMVDRKRDLRDQARAEVDSVQAALEAAQDNLSYTYLKAPYDGEVVANYVENYQDVRAKERVVRLLDRSRIKMVVGIPENMIGQLPYVSDIRVTFDALPDQSIPAEVYEVGAEASLSTRTYPVTLVMNQPDGFRILAGMAGRARGISNLPEDQGRHGVRVPVGAVFTPDTEMASYVWVIDRDNGQVNQRPVVTSELSAEGLVIEDGLKPGEWIAVAGINSLHEGLKVRILDEPGR